MSKYLRNDLQQYEAYHSAHKPYEVKLDANESPFPHHPDFIHYMKAFMSEKDHMTRYPDTDANTLREAIAAYYHVNRDQVICGVGSDQIIDLIVRSYIQPGDQVVMPSPSFSMYQLSTVLNHGIPIEINLTEDYEYDVVTYIQRIQEVNPALVFLCTPNNPTGCVLERQEVIDIIEACSCPIVVDEAYAEFTGISVIDLVDTYDHLIVLRTFSKAFGLAGLRTGYGIACQELIDDLYRAKPPYNLSTIAQEASLFVLKHHDYYLNLVDQTNQMKEQMILDLMDISFVETVYPSGTNFILLRVTAEGIKQLLEEDMILVRAYQKGGPLDSCIRITVGTAQENERLIKALNKIDTKI